MGDRVLTPRSACIYGSCRAVNLCKGSHCVGAEMEKDGYTFRDGEVVKREPMVTDDRINNHSPLVKQT